VSCLRLVFVSRCLQIGCSVRSGCVVLWCCPFVSSSSFAQLCSWSVFFCSAAGAVFALLFGLDCGVGWRCCLLLAVVVFVPFSCYIRVLF